MTPSDPVPEFGLSRRMRDHEARLLADSLRTSRLTLLYAGAGTSRRALLRSGVVPLVARRETDVRRPGGSDSRVVEPFVDRRAASGAGAVPVERAVFFDAWDGEPLDALRETLRSALPGATEGVDRDLGLADLLQALSERLGARLLVVLDAGERLWAAGADPAATARFIDAFGEAVNRRRLAVNFLFAVDDRSESRLESLRRLVPRFDDSTVRLLGFDGEPAAPVSPPPAAVAVPPVLVDTALAPAPAKPRRKRPPKTPRPPTAPIRTDGVYAFIESTLTQTADASEPWHDAQARPAAAGAARRSPDGSRGAGPAARRPPGRGRADATRVVDSPADGLRPVPPTEPPSPIDEWLDAVLAWWRRRFRSR